VKFSEENSESHGLVVGAIKLSGKFRRRGYLGRITKIPHMTKIQKKIIAASMKSIVS
jgi:hypothetical protein